ncbi:GFA family protein [Mangrovimicrobium sediminis]|uniref:GFA family protein n=1 Tax=Mangrovimicrobium sediminis TaxID=2562682 RepID=A0A4Z0M4W5_9GAMM|nr:GFA family protein [Haliea sp. SAOS-164]TGD74345.1 GFA family protein [Haliea sp. SAOS-164]
MAVFGSCLCGQVSFSVEGVFDKFFICHCSYCRKDTGSAYAANLFAHADSLTWLSGEGDVRDFNLEGTRHVKSFCANCGSALPNTSMGGNICIVPAGSLDGDVPIPPQAHIFFARQASWEESLGHIPSFPDFPDS